ncbi:MAG: hypothetical protein ACREJU_02420 [Nitrospiraceae bacterium]
MIPPNVGRMSLRLLHGGQNLFLGTRLLCRLSVILLLVLLGIQTAAPATTAHDEPSGETYALLNGNWFDGHTFRPQTFYSINGVLTHTRPLKVDYVLDLANGFVVPPFAEAHNHNVDGPWNVDEVIQRYLKDGVFYVKIPGDIRELTDRIRQKITCRPALM